MPSRPDLRDITTGVRDALADCDRETLLDVLTFVLKEYVVDGPPPMLMHQAETIADLGRLSFAQLVSTLQTRLDIAELGLFAVDGEQVSVRIGGVMHSLRGGATATAAPAAELPRPSAGVRVVETATRPAPGAPTAPMAPSTTVTERAAPPPARGLSIRGQPAGAMAPRGGDEPAPAPPPAAPPAAAPPPPEKPTDSGGDDSAARFSLLELD